MKKKAYFIIMVALLLSCISMIEITDPTEKKAINQPSWFDIKLHSTMSAVLLNSFYNEYIESMQIKGNERVMDFGSGWATMSEKLARKLNKGGTLTCLDISEVWIDYAQDKLKKYSNTNYYCGDITQLSIPDSSYDCIVIHFVLHDIEMIYRNNIIKKQCQLLKKGGKIFIREPIVSDMNVDYTEIMTLMRNNDLQCKSLKFTKSFIMGEMMEGIFEKQ